MSFLDAFVSAITFLPGLFPPKAPAATPGAVLRVAAAVANPSHPGVTQTGGVIDLIKLYDVNQQKLGQWDNYDYVGDDLGQYIAANNVFDFSIPISGGAQTPFVQVFAGSDAACIAYMTLVMADGSNYAWAGDWGGYCDQFWYYSGIFVDDDNYQPNCTWLDSDHTNGIPSDMLFIGFPEYQAKNQMPSCGYPAFRAYANSDATGEDDKNQVGESLGKRSANETSPPLRQHPRENRLIVSPSHLHKATTLCESDTAYGPDFVASKEGVHCDMTTRKVTPVCSDMVTGDCFNVNHGQHQKRDGTPTGKSYDEVIHW